MLLHIKAFFNQKIESDIFGNTSVIVQVRHYSLGCSMKWLPWQLLLPKNGKNENMKWNRLGGKLKLQCSKLGGIIAINGNILPKWHVYGKTWHWKKEIMKCNRLGGKLKLQCSKLEGKIARNSHFFPKWQICTKMQLFAKIFGLMAILLCTI